VAAGRVSPPRQAGPLTALLMSLLRAAPAERPTMVEARDWLAAVAAGQPAPMLAGRTDLIPPVRAAGPPSPPRGVDTTRLDAHPFAEPPPGPALASGRAPLPPPPDARQGRTRNVRSIVLTALAIVAAALVGILVASLFTNEAPNPQSQQTPLSTSSTRAAPASSTTPSTTSAAPATTTIASTAPSATPSSAPSVPAALDPEAVVRQYLGLLPANPAAAWQLLTDKARTRYGSQEAYNQAWAALSRVEVLQSRAANGTQVGTVLRFTSREGATSTEVYAFALVERDGRLLIDDFVQAGPGPGGG
jgi:hypothetical protein